MDWLLAMDAVGLDPDDVPFEMAAFENDPAAWSVDADPAGQVPVMREVRTGLDSLNELAGEWADKGYIVAYRPQFSDEQVEYLLKLKQKPEC